MTAPSVHEYARFHGLAIDHTADDLLENISHIPLREADEDQQLPDPDFSVFADESREAKLQLTRHEGAVLAESILDNHSIVNWSNFLPERHRVQNLKFEEPLLTGDNKYDVGRFRREASRQVDTEHLFETCSLISSASGEDYEDEWNDIQSGRASREVEQELEDERWHTTKEALAHLSVSLKDTLDEDSKATIFHNLVPAVTPRPRSLTPLLMPESPAPQSPSFPDLDFPLRSEECIDWDSLLLQLDREMKKKDRIPSEEIDGTGPSIAKELLMEVQDEAHLECEEDLQVEAVCASFDKDRQARKDLENLHLDVPIISSSSQSERSSNATVTLPSPCERVQASSALEPPATVSSRLGLEIQPESTNKQGAINEHELGPVQEITLSPTIRSEEDEIGTIEDELDEELLKFAENAEKEIDARLRGDKISTPEECFKLQVPLLEPFSVVSPCSDQGTELLMHKLRDMCLLPPNSRPSEHDEKLNWSPFPTRFTRLEVVDSIGDDSNICRLVCPPEGVVRSEQLLWKPPGLRILDKNDDSDSEIEEDLDLHEDMSKVVEPVVPLKRPSQAPDSSRKSPTKNSRTMQSKEVQNMVPHKTSRGLSGFSASHALEAFLDLRGAKFKRVAPPKHPSTDELADDPIQATQSEGGNHAILEGGQFSQPSEALAELSPSTIQVPSTPAEAAHTSGNDDPYSLLELKWSRAILVETATLQKCPSLFSFLETKGGNQLNMIYREMSRSDRSTPPSVSPDIILNPRAALIFTNMQALNQKSLPGQGIQAGQGMVQSRILGLTHDYTQLFILITMTGPEDSLLKSQIDTMTTFTGFCANISSHHGLNVDLEFDTVNLINEETLWERFLRMAGLNPMAAQVVLGGLRKAGLPQTTFDQNWGLRRFVKMHPDERMVMFADALGRRIVERVNAVLDKNWGSG
ncbi:hypothetical protein AYO20_00258 [Fonsecaea nubica]|uniref:Uncharacterized protein n=1 Tax=Fonsecaea nubica TaxID=856822 RepID=A0A178DFR2_9EURO|nr:hypothetical protein AYO20_00258 [Fonsecaea nubica]OAL40522.1 hypothetical protein AYO20_00258 [Fonsecaea nubica]